MGQQAPQSDDRRLLPPRGPVNRRALGSHQPNERRAEQSARAATGQSGGTLTVKQEEIRDAYGWGLLLFLLTLLGFQPRLRVGVAEAVDLYSALNSWPSSDPRRPRHSVLVLINREEAVRFHTRRVGVSDLQLSEPRVADHVGQRVFFPNQVSLPLEMLFEDRAEALHFHTVSRRPIVARLFLVGGGVHKEMTELRSTADSKHAVK